MKHFSESNFGFQKLNISFSEILFQKKPPHKSLILLFSLRKGEEVFVKMKKMCHSKL